MLYYHHCRSLDSIAFGIVKANPKYSDPYLKNAYLWLRKEVGFYPLFLSVGTSEEDLYMTGYPNQWARIIGTKIVGRRIDGTHMHKNILRKRGEFPNDVLFSFEKVNGIFIDYGHWHIALNASHKNYQMTDYEKKLIFKPSWPKSKWLRRARDKPDSVQLVISKLNLVNAKRIYVRNSKTKKLLENMGFEDIEVKRMPVRN